MVGEAFGLNGLQICRGIRVGKTIIGLGIVGKGRNGSLIVKADTSCGLKVKNNSNNTTKIVFLIIFF